MITELSFFSTGLILFLFGMLRLGETIKRHFMNVRIRSYFNLAVQRPVYGLLTGIVSTILFQSSSATSVLTVGMVSAGLISFYHSLGIILGANIGTTLTVQLVVWKITTVSPLFILGGCILTLPGNGKYRHLGHVLFFFGLIFFGLSLISHATEPLKQSQTFISFFQEVRNPYLGLLGGLLFTAVIQTSAIPIAVLAILAQHGLISIENAVPIIFGANIGTAVTALLAALVANINGRRTAVSHFLFRLAGVVICMTFLPLFISFLQTLTPDVAQEIALGHFCYNLLVALLFLPILKPFAALIEKILPGEATTLSIWPEFLDERYLTNAEAALGCVRKEIEREILIAHTMYTKSIGLIWNFQEKENRNVQYLEIAVDNLRKEIIDYLLKISETSLSDKLSRNLFVFSSMADDIERIADHAINLRDRSERKFLRKIVFTEAAYNDLAEIRELVGANIADAADLILKKNEDTIRRIVEREALVDQKIREARERHLDRFCRKACQTDAGPIFVEMLLNLERISDHCENLAEYMQELNEAG